MDLHILAKSVQRADYLNVQTMGIGLVVKERMWTTVVWLSPSGVPSQHGSSSVVHETQSYGTSPGATGPGQTGTSSSSLQAVYEERYTTHCFQRGGVRLGFPLGTKASLNMFLLWGEE